MLSIRPILLCACTLLLTAFTAGCTTISEAASGAANIETLHGPPADPPPTIPFPTAGTPNSWITTVTPQSGEDLAGPCSYYLYLANPAATLRGVFVLFDRADSAALYNDADVQAYLGSLNIGLLRVQQCNAASFEDVQQNAFAGPGRELFTALDQLAQSASHPELATSPVVLFGFSASGVLAATTANYKPNRVIAVIADCGATPKQQLDTVVPTQAALQIPFLVLSNDEDTSAGTTRDQMFFAKGWKKTAPWTRAVQHGVGHCCALSTKPLILPWIAAVTAVRLSNTNELATVPLAMGVFDTYTCTPNGLEDATGYENCTFTAAALIPSGSSIANAQGWLPDATTAAAWLQWVGQ